MESNKDKKPNCPTAKEIKVMKDKKENIIKSGKIVTK